MLECVLSILAIAQVCQLGSSDGNVALDSDSFEKWRVQQEAALNRPGALDRVSHTKSGH